MPELIETQEKVRGTVCFVTLEIYPTTPGGTGVLIAQTAHALLEQGYEVIFLFGASRQDEDRFRNTDRFLFPNAGNIRSYHVLDLLPAEVDLPDNLPDDVYLVSVRFALALVELTRRHHIDLVEFYDYCGPGFHALACPELMGQAMSVRLHSTIELIARRVRQTLPPERVLHFHQEREQLRLADGLLYSGEHFYKREVCDIYPFLGSESAYASPPLLLGFVPCPPRADARDVLFYGRLSTLKGLDTFLRGLALAMTDPVFENWVGRINIAGAEETVATGLTVDEMLAVVPEKYRSRLRFLGHISHEDLQSLLPDVSFAVFANKLESFCYAAHELRVSGTPLILNSLPTFRDFFADGQTAVFFDGTASDLARQMGRLAADSGLRERLSQAGIAAAAAYHQHRYGQHIAAIRPRRIASPANALAVTALVFSTGDLAAEARTLASLEGSGLNAIVLRHDHTVGWSIAGTRWRNDFDRPRAEVDMAQLGEAVIGLRAGDLVDAGWLEAARIAMASDPRLGAIAGWQMTRQGVRTSASHLLPELALSERIGLGRLIRIAPGLLFAELAGQMKHAGEVGLLLAARKAGLALAELPRIALDSREAVVTPGFDVGMAMIAEADRLDGALMAQLPALARKHAMAPVFWRDGFTLGEPVRATMALERGLCRIVARPDLAVGDVALLRTNPVQGGMPAPKFWFIFTGKRRAIAATPQPLAELVPEHGSVTFPASDESTIELRQGPKEGVCEIEYDGRTVLVDLRREQAASITLRLGDFAELGKEKALPQTANRQVILRLEARLSGAAAISTLTIADPKNWIARRAIPLGSPVIAIDELLAEGVPAAVATLCRWQRQRRIRSLAIAVESDASFKLLDALVNAGAREVTALLPGQIDGFAGEGGYSAATMAASAVVMLARRAADRGQPIAVGAQDETLAEAIGQIGAPFHRLASSLPTPLWAPDGGSPTIAVIGSSQMAHVRTHLVAAAMLLRKRLGTGVRILIPADESAGSELLGEFQVLGIERFSDLAEIDQARGPAVALAVYPDPIVVDAAFQASALGYAPLMGPACFRWATDGTEAADAARFRVNYWDDALTIATAAQALLDDWSAATAAWDRLRDGESQRLSAMRAHVWGAAAAAELTG
ncbi:MAG: glycosyltransferase family 4 protein [Sphingomonas sp.]|nr:glycosyltransferase family 4 protein [Sphingomonas sp.]